MEFKLLKATKETARQWQDTILATGIERIENYTGLNQPNRYYTGYCGELTFRDGLWFYGKRWFYRAHLDGRAHQSDIRVWVDDEPRDVDVKTSSQSWATDMLVSERQFGRHRSDYYVGAKFGFGSESIEFLGWATRAEIARWPKRVFKTMSHYHPYADLHDMEELLAMLDPDESSLPLAANADALLRDGVAIGDVWSEPVLTKGGFQKLRPKQLELW